MAENNLPEFGISVSININLYLLSKPQNSVDVLFS